MSDEIDLGKLSDRDLLILAVQTMNSHSKRLDSHAGKIRSLELWRNWLAGAGSIIGAGIAAAKLHVSIKQGP